VDIICGEPALTGTGAIQEAILPTRFERVSLLPSSTSLASIETRLGEDRLQARRRLGDGLLSSAKALHIADED